MLQKHFEPYYEMLLKLIKGCTMYEQVHICNHLAYEFCMQFRHIIPAEEFEPKRERLYDELAQKSNELK